MRLVTLTQSRISKLDENPECRGCCGILFAGEKVYATTSHGAAQSQWTKYFCRNCIENKDILIYPIHARGRTKAPVNYSLPFHPRRGKKMERGGRDV